MKQKNRNDERIVVITRKEAEQYFMSSIRMPPTPEDIMIRTEDDHLSNKKEERRTEMRRWTMIMLVAAFVFTLGCTQKPAEPQKVLVTKPASGDWLLGKYHILKKKELTPQKIKELGLSPKVLDEETYVLSYNGKTPTDFTYKPLPAGTVVLMNAKGNVVYTYDCANRTYVPLEKKWITPPADKGKASGKDISSGPVSKAPATSGSWWSKLWDYLSSAVWSVLWIFLLLALIAILAWLLWHLIHWLQHHDPTTPHPQQPQPPPVSGAGGGGAAAGGFPIVPGPQPNENGVGVFAGPNGFRVVGRGISDEEINIRNNGHVEIDFTVFPHA